MGVLHEVLRQFAVVFTSVLCDGICTVFLLEEHIPCVGDVGENDLHIGIDPGLALPGVDAARHQRLADLDA